MKKIILCYLLASHIISAQELFGDIDYKPNNEKEFVILEGTDYFRADNVNISTVRAGKMSLELTIKKGMNTHLISPIEFVLKGTNKILSDGNLQEIDYCKKNPNEKFRISYLLSNTHFQIAYKKTYELLFDLRCGEKTQLVFDYDSTGGQVIGILDIVQKAKAKLETLNLLSFWKKKIKIRWPGSGDYYSFNTVNVTKGYQWDVIGHELGHAIYDQANIGVFGGGQHFIDRCYSKALALSEGWASLFSAWLSVSQSDNDAKFEYMVPRRAPLRFETIPDDVCHSDKNEWRVTGFLWDLIDLNQDLTDTSQMKIISFWKNSENQKFRSAKQLAQRFVAKGFDPILMSIIWKQNFLTEFEN